MRKSKLYFEIAALVLCLHLLVGTTKGFPQKPVIPKAEDPDFDDSQPDIQSDDAKTDYTEYDSTNICTGDKDKDSDCVLISPEEVEVQEILQNAFIGRKVLLEKDKNVVFNYLVLPNSSPANITTVWDDILSNANSAFGELLRPGHSSATNTNTVVRANAYSRRYCYYQAIVNMTGSELWCGDLENKTTKTLITTSTTSADYTTLQMSPNGQQVFYTNVDDRSGIWVTNLETMHSALLVATEYHVTRFYVDWENARAFTVESRKTTGGSTESNLTSWDLQMNPLSPVKPEAQAWKTSNSTIKSITAEPRNKSLYWKVDNGSVLKLQYDFIGAETEPRVILKGNSRDDGDFQGEPMFVNNGTLIYVSLKNAEKANKSQNVQLRLRESVTDIIHFRNIDPKVSGELETTAFYTSDSHSIAIGMDESCRSCSHLCIPVGPSESRCTCPYEFELEGGIASKTCSTPENLTIVFEDANNAEWGLAEYNVMTKKLWTLAYSKTKMELIPYFGSKPRKCFKTENGKNITSVACIDESGTIHTLNPVSNPGRILAITSNEKSKWSVYWLDSSSGCLKEDTDSSTYTMYCDEKLQQESGLLTRLDPTKNLLFVIEQAINITVINWATHKNLLVHGYSNFVFHCGSNVQVDFNQGQRLSLTCGKIIGHLDYTNINNISLDFLDVSIDATSVFEDVDKRQWYLSNGAIYTRRNKSPSVIYKVYGLPDTLRLQALQKPLSYEDYSKRSHCSHYFEVDQFESETRFTCYCPYELPILHGNGACGSIRVTSLSQEDSRYRFDLYDSNSEHLESYFNLTDKPVSSLTLFGSNRTCYVDRSNHLKCSNANSFSSTPHLDVSSNVTQLAKPNIQTAGELYWLQTDNSRSCLYFSKTPEGSVHKIKLRCWNVGSDQEMGAPKLDVLTMTLFWCQRNISSKRSSLQWISVKQRTSSVAYSQSEIECMDIALSNNAGSQMSALYVSNSKSITTYDLKLVNASTSEVNDTDKLTSTSTFVVRVENPKELLKTTQPTKSLTFFDNYLLWIQNDTSKYQVKLLDLGVVSTKRKVQHLPINKSNASVLQFDVAQAPSRTAMFTSPCGTNTCQDQSFCIPLQNPAFECWCSGEDGLQDWCPTAAIPTIPITPPISSTTEVPPPPDCESSECESSTWIWILLGCFLSSFIMCAICFRYLVKRPNEPLLQWSNMWAYVITIPRQWALRPDRRQSYDAVRSKDSLRPDARSSTVLETSM